MAEEFANSPDVAFKTIETAKKSMLKSTVSIKGTVEEVRVHTSIKGLVQILSQYFVYMKTIMKILRMLILS